MYTTVSIRTPPYHHIQYYRVAHNYLYIEIAAVAAGTCLYNYKYNCLPVPASCHCVSSSVDVKIIMGHPV